MNHKLVKKGRKLHKAMLAFMEQILKEGDSLQEFQYIDYENGDLIVYFPYNNQEQKDYYMKRIGILLF